MDANTWRAQVTDTFDRLKQAPFGSNPIVRAGWPGLSLLPVTADCVAKDELIESMRRWRAENINWFLKVFQPTFDGTRFWAQKLLIERPDRMLFLVAGEDGRLVGHVGLSSFDFEAGTCEIDNIIRGERACSPGIMQSAIAVMLDWAYEALQPREIQLRTVNDNVRALALYHRLGFVPFEMEPLVRTETDGITEWVAATDSLCKIDRFFLAMRHRRAD